jgi:hypothetical protein
VICDVDAAHKAKECAEGYVCDEMTTEERSTFFRCREGYVCDFGTTPDSSLEAPQGQFKRLCPIGFFCRWDTPPIVSLSVGILTGGCSPGGLQGWHGSWSAATGALPK